MGRTSPPPSHANAAQPIRLRVARGTSAGLRARWPIHPSPPAAARLPLPPADVNPPNDQARMRPLLALVFLAAAASRALAQAPAADTLRGRVVDPAGRPVAGANVFAVGSLDGAVTDG